MSGGQVVTRWRSLEEAEEVDGIMGQNVQKNSPHARVGIGRLWKKKRQILTVSGT